MSMDDFLAGMDSQKYMYMPELTPTGEGVQQGYGVFVNEGDVHTPLAYARKSLDLFVQGGKALDELVALTHHDPRIGLTLSSEQQGLMLCVVVATNMLAKVDVPVQTGDVSGNVEDGRINVTVAEAIRRIQTGMF